MPLNHIGITVRNLAASDKFYAAALAPIGSAHPYRFHSRTLLIFLATRPIPL